MGARTAAEVKETVARLKTALSIEQYGRLVQAARMKKGVRNPEIFVQELFEGYVEFNEKADENHIKHLEQHPEEIVEIIGRAIDRIIIGSENIAAEL